MNWLSNDFLFSFNHWLLSIFSFNSHFLVDKWDFNNSVYWLGHFNSSCINRNLYNSFYYFYFSFVNRNLFYYLHSFYYFLSFNDWDQFLHHFWHCDHSFNYPLHRNYFLNIALNFYRFLYHIVLYSLVLYILSHFYYFLYYFLHLDYLWHFLNNSYNFLYYLRNLFYFLHYFLYWYNFLLN